MSLDLASGFVLNKANIYSAGQVSQPTNFTDLIASIFINESLTSPFMVGKILVSDSSGLITDLPIQGGEVIELEIITDEDEKTQLTFRVWKISNRVLSGKIQTYTLDLISTEAMVNEVVEVYNSLSGSPQNIVSDLLKNHLKTEKEIVTDESKFDMKFLGCGRSPFNIISNICLKSVPKVGSIGDDTGKKGTSGFLFWENRRGYNFCSIDGICGSENGEFNTNLQQTTWGPYKEEIAKKGTGNEKRNIISATFEFENNIMKSLRVGKYSSRIAFFNLSTGNYEEVQYKLSDTYKNMAHLGGQESLSNLPVANLELTDNSSRLMSMVLDHETFYNGSDIASPDEKDGSKEPSQFADWQKYYASQSLFRYQLLKTQQAKILISGNLQIYSGDKIEVYFKSKVSDSRLVSGDVFDPEISGYYLIEDVSHDFTRDNSTGGVFYTTLGLIRDSYGKGKSKHGGNL